MKTVIFPAILLASVLTLAACSSGQSSPTASESAPAPGAQDEQMAEAERSEESAQAADEPAVDHMDDSAMSETAPAVEDEMADAEADKSDMDDDAEAEEPATMAADLAPWQTLPIADARSGESFTFADLAGKTVFVEPMATWCGNCRRQLGNVKEAQAQIGDENTVFVALSVETTIAPETLASYADDAGFDWTFAVMTPEMLQELSGAFGQTISNPPATPHFIIRPDGSTTDLVTGIELASDIVAQLEAARG